MHVGEISSQQQQIRTGTIRNRDNRKYKLYTQCWEQLSGNRNVQQQIKKEVHQNRKQKLHHNSRGADTAGSKSSPGEDFHRESALLQDNSQWTGENQLISPEDIIRLDEIDRLNNKTLNFDSIEVSSTRIRELSSVYYT
jgi:hypothetical protein